MTRLLEDEVDSEGSLKLNQQRRLREICGQFELEPGKDCGYDNAEMDFWVKKGKGYEFRSMQQAYDRIEHIFREWGNMFRFDVKLGRATQQKQQTE